MYWTDGSYYKGEWKEGIQHGKGKITFSDGLVKEGEFINNMYVDSKNYQYTIEQEDQNQLLHRSVYSHMPRSVFTALNDRDKNYINNAATQKRRYSNTDDVENIHSHSFQNIGNNKLIPKRKINMDQVNEQYEYEEESRRVGKYNIQPEEYDSDYMGPRKPYMREDRSTSPPDQDPIFRRDRLRSIGVQDTNKSMVLPKIHQKKSNSKPKKKSPGKIKFSHKFLKKYPQLFRGIRGRGGPRKSKNGKVVTVVYKPWVPSSRKYMLFGDIAHKYKVY